MHWSVTVYEGVPVAIRRKHRHCGHYARVKAKRKVGRRQQEDRGEGKPVMEIHLAE